MSIDDDYSLVYSNSESDSESVQLYEASITTVYTATSPANSIISPRDSEFEIEDEDQASGDEVAESVLTMPMSNSSKKALAEGSVPGLRYNCLTTKDIFESMIRRVHHLQPIFSMAPEDILVLMQRYDWNEERLLEDWTEKMDQLLIDAGLSTAGCEKGPTERGINYRDSFECAICCNDAATETFSLECGHEYCIECYRHYISDRLNKGNVITCMDCALALKNEDIDQIMGHTSSSKLMSSSIKSFVQKHNRTYKWCPFADCRCIIHLKDMSSLSEYSRLHCSPFVTCNSMHRFCFNCGFEIHAPADCDITNAWIKKAKKESKNLNWILFHTKECPKCSVNIEKNGGCNHMVCSSCQYAFCWLCGGDWKDHGNNYYKCTMYNSEEARSKDSLEDADKRMKSYTFYYKMFNESEVSTRLDAKLGQSLGTKVKNLQDQLGISWIEGQFLQESLKTLNEGRTALKWSFAVAYYSDPSHNLTKIFLDNQTLLANAVEELSGLLQIKNPAATMKKKPEFYSKAGYVENRSLALMECSRDLLQKGICVPDT